MNMKVKLNVDQHYIIITTHILSNATKMSCITFGGYQVQTWIIPSQTSTFKFHPTQLFIFYIK